MVPTGEESAAYDRYAIDEAGIPETTLMENAGRSAAHLVDRLHPRGEVVVVAGSGNNGGDGVVVARTLAAWGRPVRLLRGTERSLPDRLLHGRSVPVEAPEPGDPDALEATVHGAAVIVDALLGTGIRGAPREAQAAWIRAMNRSPAPVVSLDLPSGVSADDGSVPGEAVEASLTVAFGWPKLGTLLHPARGRVGRLVAVEIGFPPPEPNSFPRRLITPGWAELARPRRSHATHKGEVGGLLLLAGSSGMAGAAVLAARGALRSGVGYLTVASFPEVREVVQGAVPGAVFVDVTDQGALAEAVSRSRAVAAGPGLGTGDASARALRTVLERTGGAPTVLDADALNLVAEGRAPSPSELAGDRPLLLTPHPGEMGRLVPKSGEAEDRMPALRVQKTARRFSCTVLLKGAPSLVGSPGGGLLVSGSGTSDLAVAGMGDVLTGACGSFLAQGADVERAAGLGLHYTGRAAARAPGGPGLVPEDVIDHLPAALRETGYGTSELADLPFVHFDQDPSR